MQASKIGSHGYDDVIIWILDSVNKLMMRKWIQLRNFNLDFNWAKENCDTRENSSREKEKKLQDASENFSLSLILLNYY